MHADDFLKHCLLLDLETAPDGQVLALGAALGQECVHWDHPSRADWPALQTLARSAQALLGHNLLGHDVPVLREARPDLAFLQLPVVDTLYLSPLAFPENPYHRLVKDYKLVRDSLNDPLADARLAAQLFQDQWQVFADLHQTEAEIPELYRYCLTGLESAGTALLFDALGVASLGAAGAFERLRRVLPGRVCKSAFQRMVMVYLADPQRRPALAYALAWLRVAGGNSVLPPWVRYHFPDTVAVLRQLRDVPCAAADCGYCRGIHDPEGQLQRYFGFSEFRPEPRNDSGGSLQGDIIRAALGDQPLLAILPTGGGKSLGFQLPALVRHARRGVLTVVISPLQALMKDQVDNLAERTGSPAVAALYGMLTGPERGEVLERVRLGDIALLYVSPEQFRNRGFSDTIAQREIGAWVFDEAHCLSKWGHDFRPDYLYCARFIKAFSARQKLPIAPVQCFTATAKQDVIQEIRDHFGRELGQSLSLFEGGVERSNLHFEVQMVNRAEKLTRIHALLQERLGEGSGIVYCSTRKNTEDMATGLARLDWSVAAFHAGLEVPTKRRVQEDFLTGALRVICATNAFGMGIDKADVRLVVHSDIPGSLENYLQEAGRAGRDREDADCVLLYDEQDVESQFRLGAFSELSQRDIQQILRGLRRSRRDRDGLTVVSSGELLRVEGLDTSFSNDVPDADTRVKTAVAWLERAGYVERNENRNQVFQGRPRVADLSVAQSKIRELNLSTRQQARWLAILEALFNADPDEGLSADELAELAPFARQPEDPQHDTETQRVLRSLYDMVEAGLLDRGLLMTAYLRYKVKDASTLRLERACQLEQALLDCLQEAAPDAAEGEWQSLSLRALNQQLLDRGFESSPEALRLLLKSLSLDGKGLAGQQGSLLLQHAGLDGYRVKLQRPWASIRRIAQRRQAVAGVALRVLLARVPEGASPAADTLVEFAAEEIAEGLKQDTALASQHLPDPLAAVDRALMFLHEQRVIILQKGLAVFRQAMSIRVLPEARERRYPKGDYEPLAQHYQERRIQVHVMNEYARRGREKISQALALVAAYFQLDRLSFIQRFFAGREAMLARATTQESYRRIVDDLGSAEQSAVVAAGEQDNLLVLAGPGSGKTRVVVHRCAYLIRVQRQAPQSILVLCFNRLAALELRRRLLELLGEEARGILVYTYHGLALRLTGRAFTAGSTDVDFTALLSDAVALLEGQITPPGLEADELRDRLLGGFRSILVDEYQDIDEQQYRLVSAIAGRTLSEAEGKLAILAVGDDDQNIYQFRGTNVEFIRRMETDYQATRHYLAENYRSSGHIVAAANGLIQHNQDRMKSAQPLRVNRARRDLPPGGNGARLDALGQGRVQILRVRDSLHQARVLVSELLRLRSLWNIPWSQIAVIGRTWEALAPLRAALEALDVPVLNLRGQRGLPPPWRVRPVATLLARLRAEPEQAYTAAELLEGLDASDLWQNLLIRLLEDWRDQVGELPNTARLIHGFLFEGLQELAREGGEGVRLVTAHGVKGMEFTQVFIADGGWGQHQAADREAERRLYYVAMTRARESLVLAEGLEENPHTPLLSGEAILRRSGVAELPELNDACLQRRYDLLGLEDFYLSFAATRAADDPIHARLAALEPGSTVSLMAQGERLVLLAEEVAVAALSKRAAARWRGLLAQVQSVRVVAMVRWSREDGEGDYQARCRVEHWEVPVVEVIWQPLS